MSDFVDAATTATGVEPTTVEGQTPEIPTSVDGWVGDGKKYKTVDDLASAYSHADQRLAELKLENERLAAEAAEAASKNRSVEEILQAINEQAAAEATSTGTTAQPAATGIKPEDIQNLVSEQLQQQTAAAKKQAKIDASWEMMDEAFGDRAAASLAVKTYMGDDPGRKAIVNSMAVSDPVGLMKLLGKDVEKKPTTFTSTHEGNTNPAIDLESKLTWAMVHKIRKEDPKLYYSHAFRQRMNKELD